MVAKLLAELYFATMRVTLRAVTLADVELLWRWRNDPETRKWFGDTRAIPLHKHECWFAQRFLDPAPWFIGLADGVPAGVVRFEGGDGHYEVSVSVIPEYRKHGIGSQMLAKACQGSRFVLHATIKPGNTASEKLFTRCGFRQTGTIWERHP